MATANVYTGLPIRQAALKQINHSFDPKSIERGEVKDPEQHLRKKSTKTPKTPSAECLISNQQDYRETPPSSPEYVERTKKYSKKKTQGRNLFTLLGDPTEISKKKPGRKPREAKPDYSDDDTDDESVADRRATQWFEAIATPEDMDMEKLVFPEGCYFLGKYKILCFISISAEKGATYIAYRNRYEVVLRVNFIQRDDMELINTESKFLEVIELNDAQHLFSTIFDMGIVNKEKADGLVYYATVYRGGPTLAQCHEFCMGTFTSETINRLACQMITIFEQICGLGYSLLSFSLEDFTIDRRSRAVFLNNYTNIVKSEGIEDDEMFDMTMYERTKRSAWEGDPDFAPMKWHQEGDDHVMTETDSVEALVYLLIHLHTGHLPWKGQRNKAKLKVFHANVLKPSAVINFVPPSLKCLWLMVLAEESPCVSFSLIHRMFSKYAKEDEDFCYDWESNVPASDDQERLIGLADEINDTQQRIDTLECIFETATKLTER